MVLLAIYGSSIAACVGVAILAFGRRTQAAAALPLAVAGSAMAAYTTLFLAERFATSLAWKLVFDDAQWLPTFVSTAAMLEFAWRFNRPSGSSPWARVAGAGVATTLLGLLWWGPTGTHRLDPRLVQHGDTTILTYGFGYLFYVAFVAVFGAYFAALTLFLLGLRQSTGVFRLQALAAAVGLGLPLAALPFSLFGLLPLEERDTAPISYLFAILFLAWGLFRFRLLELSPVARAIVIENLHEAVIVLDATDRVIDLNPAARTLFSAPPDVVGKPSHEAFLGPNGLTVDLSGLEAGRAVARVVRRADGWRDVEIFKTFLSDTPPRDGSVLIARDITERRHQEAELQRQQERLEDQVQKRTEELVAANRKLEAEIAERERAEDRLRHAQKLEAVGRLAGGVAHDFNNLLNVILANLTFIEDSGTLDEQGREDLKAVQVASRRAAELTRQLLAFGRKQVLEPRIFAVNAVADDVAKLLRRVLGAPITLKVDLDPHEPRVRADQGQLQQVLMNLAINGRDAMPSGGTLTLRTILRRTGDPERPTDLGDGDHVELSVTDTGTGIAPDELPKLFEPFYTTKPAGTGTGLGLATVHGIVSQSGGRVTVTSVLGVGSTFRVWLPTTEAPLDPAGPTRAPPPRRVATERILVVEDQLAVRQLVERVLVQHGYQVTVAPHAEQAWAILLEEPLFDLLITDASLPGASGPKLVADARAREPATKVLYISGHADLSPWGRGGPDAPFLAKPFTPSALIAKVRSALGSSV